MLSVIRGLARSLAQVGELCETVLKQRLSRKGQILYK